MTQSEFERLAMRAGEHCPDDLYDAVEWLYMSDSPYHQHNNPAGADESKQSFCGRVYGTDNTMEMVYQKTIAELIRENQHYAAAQAARSDMPQWWSLWRRRKVT